MAIARRYKTGETRVPTDSLSDIAFLLIIFFILTTSIRQITGFSTEMPSGEKKAEQQADRTPTIAVNNQTIRFNDEVVTMDALRQRLKSLRLDLKSGDRRVVMLEATGSVPYQTYYEVMAAVSAAGGVVGVVTEEKSAKR